MDFHGVTHGGVAMLFENIAVGLTTGKISDTCFYNVIEFDTKHF